jgi:predicted PurR-regulated permease PerM
MATKLIAGEANTPSVTRLLVGIASVVVILAGIKAAADIINPAILALFVVLIVSPANRWLRRRGVPAAGALAITIIGVLVSVIALIVFLGVSMAQLAAALPTYQTQLEDQTAALRSLPGASGAGRQAVDVVTGNVDRLVQLGLAVIGGVVDVLFGVGWMLYLFIFMMLETTVFPGQLERALGTDSPSLARVTRFARSLSDFMAIKAWLGFLAAAGDVVFLSLLGVDFALLWGVLSFFLSFIPSIGFLLALIPPMLVALLQHGPGTAVVVLLGYWLINGVVDSVIGPRLLGQGLELSTIVTILTVVLWGFLLGGIGALLALPLTVLIKLVLLERYPETGWLATAIGIPPPKDTTPSDDRPAADGQIQVAAAGVSPPSTGAP